MEISLSYLTLIESESCVTLLLCIIFIISDDFCTYASSIPLFLKIKITALLELLGSPYSTFKLHGTQHKGNLVKNAQSCDCWLTIFLSRINNFKLVSLKVNRALINFSLMSAGVWMNLTRQIWGYELPAQAHGQAPFEWNQSIFIR